MDPLPDTPPGPSAVENHPDYLSDSDADSDFPLPSTSVSGGQKPLPTGHCAPLPASATLDASDADGGNESDDAPGGLEHPPPPAEPPVPDAAKEAADARLLLMYQHQLRLLEQQNKERLRMARQEMDVGAMPSATDCGFRNDSPDEAGALRARMLAQQQQLNYQHQLRQIEEHAQDKLRMAGLDIDSGSTPRVKVRASTNSSEADALMMQRVIACQQQLALAKQQEILSLIKGRSEIHPESMPPATDRGGPSAATAQDVPVLHVQPPEMRGPAKISTPLSKSNGRGSVRRASSVNSDGSGSSEDEVNTNGKVKGHPRARRPSGVGSEDTESSEDEFSWNNDERSAPAYLQRQVRELEARKARLQRTISRLEAHVEECQQHVCPAQCPGSPSSTSDEPQVLTPKSTGSIQSSLEGRAYITLHSVLCQDTFGEYFYLDAPQPRRRAQCPKHVAGKELVLDPARLLASLGPSLDFVVLRRYCCDDEEPLGRWGSPQYLETVEVFSQTLKNTISEIARFAPSHGGKMYYADDRSDEEWRTTGDGVMQREDGNAKGSREPEERYIEYLNAKLVSCTDKFLYHHESRLRSLLAEQPERHEVRSLLAYIDEKRALRPARPPYEDDIAEGVVSSHTLDWLFCPHDVIVGGNEPAPEAFVVEGRREVTPRGSYKLWVWKWRLEGDRLVREYRVVLVGLPPKGKVPITSLRYYPLRFASEKTKKKLVDDGKKFWDLLGNNVTICVEPDHPMDSNKTQPPLKRYAFVKDKLPAPQREAIGSVAGPRRPGISFSVPEYPKCPYDPRPQSIYYDKTEVSDDILTLVSRKVTVYSLTAGQNVTHCVANLKQPDFDKSALDGVVLSEDTRNWLQLILQGCVPNPSRQPDLPSPCPGLRAGFVLHLHGPPGCGKMTAARAVAEACGRPSVIYNPYAATYPSTLTIHAINNLAPFGTVLILGRADSLLESDAQGGSKVGAGGRLYPGVKAAVLRLLEHYPGIVILTTTSNWTTHGNMGTLKMSPQYRAAITTTVELPGLDWTGREKVWGNWMGRLRDMNERMVQLGKDMRGRTDWVKSLPADMGGYIWDKATANNLAGHLANRYLDGHEIHNAVRRAVARAGGSMVHWSHLLASVEGDLVEDRQRMFGPGARPVAFFARPGSSSSSLVDE